MQNTVAKDTLREYVLHPTTFWLKKRICGVNM